MKVKIDQLFGIALDWAVTNCLDQIDDESADSIDFFRQMHSDYGTNNYSTDRELGGQLIEDEHITVGWGQIENEWWAENEDHYWGVGPTILIAGLQCFVMIKMNASVDPDDMIEYIDIPDVLMTQEE